MTINISFEHPFFDEGTILSLTVRELDDFYSTADEEDRFNLYFILEASLNKLEDGRKTEAAARCSFLMAYYLFTPLTPPASLELAKHYIDKAVALKETVEYQEWKKIIYNGN